MTSQMEKIVSLAKRRGFVFPSSEIYGGLESCYDYGPLGVELKNNIKRVWWKAMVQMQEDIVGQDASILMHPKIWEASGHVEGFTDPLVDCKSCKKRFRADHIVKTDGPMTPQWMKKNFEDKKPKCPACGGELTPIRKFNLMLKTHLGPVEDEGTTVYMRPETAQAIYVDFDTIMKSSRKRLPFGIAQIGKAFRNEITPGDFTFRTREFEQMEMQWFTRPRDERKIENPQDKREMRGPDEWFEYWKQERMNWYLNLGLRKERLRFREQEKDELAHYAKKAVDIEYNFPFGWKEIEGIHNRGDWDLKRHSEYSGKDLSVTDDETKEKYIPWVIETSAGADRTALAFLLDAYEDIAGGRTTTTESAKETETVLRFSKNLAPVKIAVLPLSKKEELSSIAKNIAGDLRKHWTVDYDETASIGRRYRRQDEIGTLFAVTIDFETLEDKKVTVRDRDTMKQDRVEIVQLMNYFQRKLDND